MSRRDWTFEVPAARLLDAARKKDDYHTARKNHWEDVLEKTEKEMVSTGITVKKYPVSGGMRRERSFDTALERRCNEAEEKIGRHKKRIEEYCRFMAALSEAEGRSFELDISDWEFFGL